MSVGGKKVKMDTCTEERVKLQEFGDYCKMYYAGMKKYQYDCKTEGEEKQ